ncbi:MAG: tryptophan--tRNA ligase [Candidatus Bipolaricaulota bacterium]|nr:tryptophan--tRNA ligase [Candidatus Bipolaricaulota bacterium]MBS3791523.1 tryptophan--tRNA ligase [Candidatus Bipolaricaulota bacterium]
MPKLFSGIQPTGELHLGNYFGAITNWVDLQQEHETIYCIVDLHAITSDYDPEVLRESSVELATDLIASGIDPEKSILFIQSDVREHVELQWIFNSVTSYGDLTRMTQFKDKSEKMDFVSAGLFDYPVLQAADILLYRASRVPVGEDQVQHVELTRRIARKFNSRFEEFFPEPEPIVGRGARIMSTADPERKMSKSDHDKHAIGLMEDEDSIWEKIKSAVTDPGNAKGDEMSPGVANLFTLLELTASESTVEEFREDHREGNLMYIDLKEAVHENLMSEIRPVRERKEQLMKNRSRVEELLDKGKEKAKETASRNMEEVRKMVGVGPT